MTVAEISPHVAAVVGHLSQVAATRRGAGGPPDGAGWAGAPGVSAYTAWVQVNKIGSQDVRSTSLEAGWDEAAPDVQLTVVAADAAQAEQTHDLCVARMRTLTVPARRMVQPPRLLTSLSTWNDYDAEVAVVLTGSQWRLWTVPDDEENGS